MKHKIILSFKADEDRWYGFFTDHQSERPLFGVEALIGPYVDKTNKEEVLKLIIEYFPHYSVELA